MLLTKNRVLWGAVIACLLLMGSMVWLAALYPSPNVMRGEFRLTTHKGEVFTQNNLIGQEHLLFFGFTHCPDVCPTTLIEVSKVLSTSKMGAIFITVDPERDTLDQMKLYLSSFDQRITGLTGSVEEIERVLKIYRIYARKIPLDKGGYTMDHTSAVYHLDSRGYFIGIHALK